MISLKFLAILSCLIVFVAARDLRVNGGRKALSGKGLNDAEEVLRNSLKKLATGSGPNFSLIKIHSATRQIVAGSLYRYQVDLQDQKKKRQECNVEIWAQPWLPNGIEVTFECKGLPKIVKNHSP